MLAVQAPLTEIEALVAESNQKVVLANRNSPDQGVLSGSTAAIQEIEKVCKTRKIKAIRLPVSAAFHSEQLNSAVGPLQNALKKVSIKPTAVDVFSNTTANAYPADPAAVCALLSDQLIRPVDFVNEIENMYSAGCRTFVEIGPKSVLTGLISATLQDRQFEATALDASAGKAYGVADLARLIGRLAALGYPVSLTQWENPISSNRKSRMNVLLKGTNFKNRKTEDRRQRQRRLKAEGGMRKVELQRTEGQKTDVRSQKAEVRGQRSEVRGQAIEVKGQKTEDRIQKTEDRRRKTGDSLRRAQPGQSPNHNQATSLNNPINQNYIHTFTDQQNDTMKKEANPKSEFIRDAYRVVAEGLKSMQRLQSQTAQAHQKFLETQAEANRTLQEMMKSTQRLAQGTLEIPAESNPPQNTRQSAIQSPPVLPMVEHVPAPGMIEDNANPASSIASRETDAAQRSPAEWSLPHAAANGYAKDEKNREPRIESVKQRPDPGPDVETTMLEIVSRLTGYPVEMLGLDMDIEAELGIDSIKRVEILSNLEEAIPDLPAVSPEIMGSLKTLGQIVEFVKQPGGGQADEARSTDSAHASPSAPAVMDAESAADPSKIIEATMLEVVSQLTGYPVEMLGLDMDIEAELGIDSIKRVEILSSLEEKMPDLPSVSPDMMGTLKTLGQIAEFICNGKPENTAENRSEDTPPDGRTPVAGLPSDPDDNRQKQLTATMLEVVSRLTGYPEEMLGLDMDIEAELGIDSIKRVEILSTLEEKMPDLPAVSPDMIGSLKTLGQIAEYLANPAASDITTEKSAEIPPQGLSVVAANEPENSLDSQQPGNDSDQAAIPRNVVTVVDAPPVSEARVRISSPKKIFVTEDHTGLSEEITEALAKLNIKTVRISLDILKYKSQLPEAAGLIIVQDPRSNQMHQDLKDAFLLAKYLAPNLMASAGEGGAIFATVTRLDGAFGLKRNQVHHPIQGGLAGLAKTAAIEWKDVCCHAIDIAPDWSDKPAIASAIVKEVMSPGPIEIGLDSDSRCTLSLETESRPVGSINLNPEDVVVISGGARGVTAAAALELARHTGPRLVLLGRSPEPFKEPQWLSSPKG